MTAEFRIEDTGQKALVNPKELLRQLAVLGSGDEVFTADVGNHPMWAAQELLVRKDQK